MTLSLTIVDQNNITVEVTPTVTQTISIDRGLIGPPGPAGTGVPVGGTANQVLAKKTNDNYDTQWVDPTAGSGTVTSVTATSPVESTGGNDPVISMPAATTSVSGYLTAADWATFNTKTSNTGTVTSVSATAGTGIHVTGSPITDSGTLTIENTAPDQTVSLTAGIGISTSGTYPNFTVTNSAPDRTVAFTNGTGISVTGTYPNFTIENTAPSSGGTVTSVAATSPVNSTGGVAPVISMDQSSASVSGYLSATDWTTFNSKGNGTVTSVSGSSPVNVSTGTTTPAINLSSGYGDTQNPYASKSAKYVLAAPNALSGLPTFRQLNNTDITGLGTSSTKDVGSALGVATLDAAGKVPLSQIPDSLIGALSYQGAWNAATNSPVLTSSSGTHGHYYVVNVPGSTNLNGITDWLLGDWAVFNGSIWQKIDNTDAVTSVNGLTGTVVLSQSDIAGTVPTTRTMNTGTGLSGGGDLSADITLSIADTGVVASTYGTASKTLAAIVNAQGQITSLSESDISIANTQVSGLGTMSVQDSDYVSITAGLIDGCAIGSISPASGIFTDLVVGATVRLGSNSAQYIEVVGDALYPYIKAAGAAANIPFIGSPKGAGGLQAQAPDNTIVGGNVRGVNSVDFQTARDVASQVSSGARSVVSGGFGNTSSNLFSAVGGGAKHVSSGFGSFIGGGGCGSNGAIGFGNTASGASSFIGSGISNNNSGLYSSIVGGAFHILTGTASAIIAGRGGNDRGISGSVVITSGYQPIGAAGNSQATILILGVSTNTNASTVLRSDANVAAVSNQLTLPNNAAYYFKGSVVSGVTGGGDSKAWTIEGVIKRGASAASTQLVGIPTVTTVAQDVGAGGWFVTVSANTTFGCLQVSFTGTNGITIRTVCRLDVTEMTY